MKIYNILIVLCLCGLLASCASAATKPASGLQIQFTDNGDTSEFLNFSAQYSSSALAIQKQELILTNQSLALNPANIVQRMKLVMIYGLPNSQLQDIPKAQNLLQNLLQENILSNTQLSFAHLLFDQVLATSRLNQKIRDEQKRTESMLQKNINLQLNLDAAQQKIQELRNIEKLMGERELSAPNSPK
jgi:hypothetical protein